jgi:rhamnopyranosyl-N-acetylglucosaminyl-diphospho-decaprenol beta-1,3/1,4-galactofuranosyltransferase
LRPAKIAGVRVCAIVVTFERWALLEECLRALLEQTRAPDEVLVVDNASGDGTPELVRERFPSALVRTLPSNRGAAGGFAAGLAWGHERGHDWLWCLDDDTIAAPDALERLLDAAARAPGRRPLLLCSRVDWTDGEMHPMNRPVVRWRWSAEFGLGASEGLVLIRSGTWVSALFARECVDRFGLPPEHYFLWTEDVEYTTRVLRDDLGYLVPDSRVEHRTKTTATALDDTSTRFYFHVRNYLLFLRGSGLRGAERLNALRFYVATLARYLARRRFRPAAAAVVLRGLRDGARGATR